MLCVTVTADTTSELRARRDAAGEGDLVELRLDSVRDPDVAGALADRRCPVIVTCRPIWEGGWFKGAEEKRRALLTEALNLGAEYVDIEWRAGFDDLVRSRRGRNIVLSMHDFAERLPTWSIDSGRCVPPARRLSSWPSWPSVFATRSRCSQSGVKHHRAHPRRSS